MTRWACRILGIAAYIRWRIATIEAKPNKRMRDWAAILNWNELLHLIEGRK